MADPCYNAWQQGYRAGTRDFHDATLKLAVELARAVLEDDEHSVVGEGPSADTVNLASRLLELAGEK